MAQTVQAGGRMIFEMARDCMAEAIAIYLGQTYADKFIEGCDTPEKLLSFMNARYGTGEVED